MAKTSTRSLWKGAITFGLVHIPIGLYSATEESDVNFDWLDRRIMDSAARSSAGGHGRTAEQAVACSGRKRASTGSAAKKKPAASQFNRVRKAA